MNGKTRHVDLDPTTLSILRAHRVSQLTPMEYRKAFSFPALGGRVGGLRRVRRARFSTVGTTASLCPSAEQLIYGA